MAIVVAGDAAAAAGLRFTHGSIEYTPGTSYPRLEITLGTNPAILEPMPSVTDFQAQTAYQRRMMAFADWDDPIIEITIPMIDYGGGISITDAMISKGLGVSFDAGHFAATNMIRHVGTVTISEFTEDVIEGTFSAALFSVVRPKEARPEGSVSGWFRISLPGLNDPRIDNQLSEGERVRLNAAATWDLLRGTGMSLDDADQFSGGGGGGGPAGPAALELPSCDCRCEVLLSLPDYHECVVPAAPCFNEWQSCRAQAAAPPPVPAPAVTTGNADIDAILDLLGGPDAPPEARAMMRQSLQDLTPEELTQMLQMYRQAAGQQ